MAGQATDATPAEAEAEAPRYRVTGEFVNVRTETMAGAIGVLGGRRGSRYVVIGVYRHGLVPADAPAEDIERLLGKGMIEQVPA